MEDVGEWGVVGREGLLIAKEGGEMGWGWNWLDLWATVSRENNQGLNNRAQVGGDYVGS